MALAKRNKVKEEEVQEEVQDVVESEVEQEDEVEQVLETHDEVEQEEEEVEQEEEEVVVGSTSKEVASKPSSNTPQLLQGQGNVSNKLKEEGFDEVDLDNFSFPLIKLAGGNFETSDEEDLGSDPFRVRIQGSKKRYLVSHKLPPGADDDDESEIEYCFDKADIEDPTTAAGAKVKSWREDGLELAPIKEYLDVMALIDEEGHPLEGSIVILQIPPRSKSRFQGYIHNYMLINNETPKEYITEISRGKKVTGVAHPFYPWAFKRVAG